jgi:NADH:ubiquinone oxidoreductase subunit E
VSGTGHPPSERVGTLRKHGREDEFVTPEQAAKVPRFGHGSRVPGWDDAADLTKEPMGVPDVAATEVPADLRAEIEAHMDKYPDRRSAALPCLASAQRVHGWCSPTAIAQTAAVMRLTPAYLVSVASFYDMLDTAPVGPHRVYVCTNISCSLNGGRELFDAIQAHVGDDPDIDARHFECLGACDIAPMASVDNIYVGPITLDEVPELVDQIRNGKAPLPAKQLAGRRSVDPNAAAAPGSPVAAGEPMRVEGVGDGPPAPIEQAPDPPSGPEPKE